jgi:hypothetical protein
MSRTTRIAISSFAALAALGGIALFYSAPSQADDRGGVEERRHKDTDVTWSPPALSFSVKPGATLSLPVTFTARDRIDEDTVIYASTSLKDIVSVTPTTIGPLKKGQTGTITVVVKLPILQGAGTTTGFIQLYDNDKRNGRRPERAGMPLAIAVASVCPCLPPDPGDAGKATIQGIDSDNDGVRDDVQRYIATAVPDSARHREALLKNAAITQRILVAQSQTEAVQLANESVRTMECLDYLGFISLNKWKEVKALMINTPARLQALQQHSSRINGQVFTTLPDALRSTAFDFDPNTLPN